MREIEFLASVSAAPQRKPENEFDTFIQAGAANRQCCATYGPRCRRFTELGTEQDRYSILARMIAEVSRDHAHLRTFIYEFARVKLRKELYPLFVEGAWSEIEEQVRGLEAAIDRIEADFAQNAPSLQFEFDPRCPLGLRNNRYVVWSRCALICKKQQVLAWMISVPNHCLFVHRRSQSHLKIVIPSRTHFLASTCARLFGVTRN